MHLDYYNLEKQYEFQQKETEKRANNYWKWAKPTLKNTMQKQKEVSVKHAD
jgi:hypothetical protein